MGRIAFYNIAQDKDTVLSDSQPELVRGVSLPFHSLNIYFQISHSKNGDSIFISIGDISCQRLDAQTLIPEDFWQIIDDPDHASHKNNCERAFTLNHQHYNCVMTIQLQSQQGKDTIFELKFLNSNELQTAE